MMNKEGSTKVVHLMTPGAGVLVLGRGHMSFVLCDKTFMQFFFSVPRASNYFSKESCSILNIRNRNRNIEQYSFHL